MQQFEIKRGQQRRMTEKRAVGVSTYSRWLIAASGLALAGSFSTPAWAQDINDPYDEIIVTATKSGAQNLQDVAIAITALSSEDLLKTGTASTLDVQYQTPGLVITLNGNNAQPSIRGVGSDIQGPGFEGPVAVYIDGIYQSRSASQLAGLTDVERVEVLKGPQTTLYGRNATGGAVNILTFDPSEEFSANARASYGNFGRYSVQGAIGGSLGEAVSARVSASRTKSDGYTRNTFLGTDANGEDAWSIRGKVKLEPNSKFNAVIGAFYNNQEYENLLHPINPETNPTILLFGALPVTDQFEVRNDLETFLKLEQSGVNATLSLDLGNVKLKSISSYDNYENDGQSDTDGTAINYVNNLRRITDSATADPVAFDLSPFDTPLESADFLSQEFILTSELSGPLQFTLLANYFNADIDSQQVADIPPYGIAQAFRSNLKQDAFGLGGQMRYEISPEVTLVGGLRYSYEKKEFDRVTALMPIGVFPATFQEDSWDDVSPSFAIEYKPTEDLLLYASATRGFKSGGFNLFADQTQFDQETIWSYEAGVKSSFMNNRVIANFGAFTYDYEDIQLQTFDANTAGASTLIQNAGAASAVGFEASVSVKPIDRLSLDAGVAYLDAEIDEWVTLDPDRPADGIIDRAGNQLPRAPKLTLNLSAEYNIPVSESNSMSFRAGYYYRDRVYFTPFEDSRVSQEGIGLLSGRIAFYGADERWSIAAYGKNLTDEGYFDNVLTVQALLGQVAYNAAPRTYGVELAFKY